MPEYVLQPSPKSGSGKLIDPIYGGAKTVYFEPALTFAGVTTGITYSAGLGTVTKMGQRAFFDMTFTLTSKGSATGTVDIFGPGFTAYNVAAVCQVDWSNLTNAFVHVEGFVQVASDNKSTFIRLFGLTAAGTTLVALTDADISDTTILSISGSYFTGDNNKYA